MKRNPETEFRDPCRDIANLDVFRSCYKSGWIRLHIDIFHEKKSQKGWEFFIFSWTCLKKLLQKPISCAAQPKTKVYVANFSNLWFVTDKRQGSFKLRSWFTLSRFQAVNKKTVWKRKRNEIEKVLMKSAFLLGNVLNTLQTLNTKRSNKVFCMAEKPNVH